MKLYYQKSLLIFNTKVVLDKLFRGNQNKSNFEATKIKVTNKLQLSYVTVRNICIVSKLPQKLLKLQL